MEKKFRAFYKPDFKTPDGALKFEQKIIDDELFFVYSDSGRDDIKYPFEIPFIDHNWIIQQYTGYLDDSGQEIYEGDILECTWLGGEKFIRKVLWWAESGMMCPNASLTLRRDGTIKVIGNIFENPELLDKK